MQRSNSYQVWLGFIGVAVVSIVGAFYVIFTLNFFRRLRFWWRRIPYYGPLDASQITDNLYVGSWPANHHVSELKALGIKQLICMFWEPQASKLKEPLFQSLQLFTIDLPLFPISVAKLWRGVEATLPVLARGEGVMTYCKQGIHRSVAMACCILITQGYTADEAMQHVKTQRPSADPYARHIRRPIKKFEKQWRKKNR